MYRPQMKKTIAMESPAPLFARLPVDVLMTISSYIPKDEHFVLALSCTLWRGVLPGPYHTFVFATPAIHDMAGRPQPKNLAHLGGASPSVASRFLALIREFYDDWSEPDWIEGTLFQFYESMAKANNEALFWWCVQQGFNAGEEPEWYFCAFRNKFTDVTQWLLQHASLDYEYDSDVMERVVEIILDDTEGAETAEEELLSLCQTSRVYFLPAMIVAIQRADVALVLRLWKAYGLRPLVPFQNSDFFNLWRFRLEALNTKNEGIVRCLHDLRLFPSLEASDMLTGIHEQDTMLISHASRVIEYTHMKDVCEWVRKTF